MESGLALKEEPAGNEDAIWIAEPVWIAEIGKEENLGHRQVFIIIITSH